MWGSCFWFCIQPPSPPPPPAASRHHTYNLSSHNSHTTQLTHNVLTYNSTHTTCSHTTQLTHNLLTYHAYNLSSYNSTHTQLALPRPPVITHTTCHHTTHTQLNSHTTCSHTTQLTQLAHTQLNSHTHTQLAHISHTTCHHITCSHTTQLTHNLLSRRLPSCSHTTQLTQLAHTQLNSHTTSSHTTCPRTTCSHTQRVLPDIHLRDRCGTWRHPPSFHVAGVALTALGGLWWRTGFSADAVDAAALCVAGVALGDIHLHFAWQAWH